MSTVDEGDVADPSVDVLIRVHQLVAASDNDREESSREAAAKASSLEDEVDRQRLLEEAKQTGKSRLRRLEGEHFVFLARKQDREAVISAEVQRAMSQLLQADTEAQEARKQLRRALQDRLAAQRELDQLVKEEEDRNRKTAECVRELQARSKQLDHLMEEAKGVFSDQDKVGGAIGRQEEFNRQVDNIFSASWRAQLQQQDKMIRLRVENARLRAKECVNAFVSNVEAADAENEAQWLRELIHTKELEASKKKDQLEKQTEELNAWQEKYSEWKMLAAEIQTLTEKEKSGRKISKSTQTEREGLKTVLDRQLVNQ